MNYLKSGSILFLIFVLASTGLSQPGNDSSSGSIDFKLDYELPEKTAEVCRSKIDSISEDYKEKIREKPSKEVELREEFYNKVLTELEECDPAPRLVNVSEAPDGMPEACRNRMKSLKQEIVSETNTSIGSKVPENYTKDYENVLKGCVAGSAVERLESRLKERIFGKNPDRNNLLVELFEGFFDRVKRMVLRDPSSAGESEFNPSGNQKESINRSKNAFSPF